MTSTPQSTADIGAIERRLQSVAWGLFARQMLRALPLVVCAGCGLASAALVLAVLLPRALFGGAFIETPLALAMFGSAGATLGGIFALRRMRLPNAVEAALALESRLESRDGSLPTALQSPTAFDGLLLKNAQQELAAALAAPAPHAVTTRGLVAAPLAMIMTALLAALGWNTPLAVSAVIVGDTPEPAGAGLSAINVPTGRDTGDAAAVAEAAGLRRASTELSKAAAAMRETANPEQANAALESAKAAVGELSAKDRPDLVLPTSAPATPEARAKLANDMEAASGGLKRAAENKPTSGSGSGEGNTDNTPEAGSPSRFVSFPAFKWQAGPEQPSTELAGQTPARRALVERAMRQ